LQEQNTTPLKQALGIAVRDAAKKAEPTEPKVGKAAAAALGNQSPTACESGNNPCS